MFILRYDLRSGGVPNYFVLQLSRNVVAVWVTVTHIEMQALHVQDDKRSKKCKSSGQRELYSHLKDARGTKHISTQV